MYDSNAEIAKIHFYFVMQLRNDLSRTDETIGNLFCYGEGNFIVDLYVYSIILHDELYAVDLDESKSFDICIEASAIFWTLVFNEESTLMQSKMPDKEEFRNKINAIIN